MTLTREPGTGAVDRETRRTREMALLKIVRTVVGPTETGTEQRIRATLEETGGTAGHDHGAPSGEIEGVTGTATCTGARIAYTSSPRPTCTTEQRKARGEAVGSDSMDVTSRGNVAHSGTGKIEFCTLQHAWRRRVTRTGHGHVEGRLGDCHEHLHGVSLCSLSTY